MMNRINTTITRAALLLLLIIAGGLAASAQEQPFKITYRLAMPQPNSHMFEVGIEVERPPDSAVESIDFQMPKWSPGRYAVFDFAKNVQEVKARAACPPEFDCTLADPPLIRLDDQTWRVEVGSLKLPGRQIIVFLNYKVFADDLSGTFSKLDARHANYNGHSIFMYVVNHKPDPVDLIIDPPRDWRIVNGRTETKDQREWKFPNWDIMVDTPTEIGPSWTDDSFTVDGKTYHVVVHSLGDEGGRRAALVRDIEKIVKAETEMWGPPEFDSYTFLIHFAADGRSGDGMEHLTSTQIILPGALADTGMYAEALDTVSHEFFHVWNVKRLRPIELGPWDFTRPANTRSLWIAEGITNYYGHLMLRRAGIWSEQQFISTLAQQITDVENAPGSKLMSAEESSLSAPFIDDAPHAQKTNLDNTSISYYPKGEILGLVLDLLIRGKTGGKASLDDVMRKMYEQFYLNSSNASYYLRGRGYTGADFEKTVSDVAGADMSEFFKRYVRGVESPPYEEAFAQVGLRFTKEVSQFTLGIAFDEDGSRGVKISRVFPNSPAQEAGLEADDVIISFGGVRVSSKNWQQLTSKYKAGDRVELSVRRGRRTMPMSLTLGQPRVLSYRIEENKEAPAAYVGLRALWLKGK